VSTIVLRRARAGDIGAVAAIERRAFSDPWSAQSFAALLGEPRVLFLVAARGRGDSPEGDGDGAVVGYVVVWTVAGEAEIANIAVAPDTQRAGIGARLLDAALAHAASQRCVAVYLEVRESNRAARALYAGRGFEEVGRRRRYYRLPEEDALVLRRAL
jgi:ribosomal-protein-alanine N-acetyltransferase